MILDNPWLHGLILGGAVTGIILAWAAFGTWWERRFAGIMQQRRGPVWVGPWGLFQVVADALKLLQKEDLHPRTVDRVLWELAPASPFFLATTIALVVPVAATVGEDGSWQAAYAIAHLDMGVLWALAMGGLMIFPLWAAGWSANNKYTLLSAMRRVAQGISYEIPMVLAVMVPVILAGSLELDVIATTQAEHVWFAFTGVGTAAFAIYFATILAESDRIPFDIPDAESEIVGGVRVEYTGMKMGMLMFSDYIHLIVGGALASVLFLGGAHLPFVSRLLAESAPVWVTVAFGAAVMFTKTMVFFHLFLWVRWSLLRLRSDQLMNLAWKWMVPISLGLVMASAVAVYVLGEVA